MEKNKKSAERPKKLEYEEYPQDVIHLDITENNELQMILISKRINIGIELKTGDKKVLRYLRRVISAVLEKDDKNIAIGYI